MRKSGYLQQLGFAPIESYIMDDEEALQITLEALIALSIVTFDYFLGIWDETKVESNLSGNRAWFQDMLYYLDHLPEDTTYLDLLNTEFVIRYWQVYGILVTGYN